MIIIVILLVIICAILLIVGAIHDAQIRRIRRIVDPPQDMSEADADDRFWSSP
jgi:hypothetical protein